MFFFLLSYSILGAGIKYIDDAFDEKTFSKLIAITITPLLSILGAYAMLIDPISATILLAILCGVFIKGKVDNYAFIAGLLLVVALVFLAGIEFIILPLILLASAAILDEVGNDYMDKRKEDLDPDRFLHKFVIYFFGHRWIMKVAILFLVALGIIPFYFFLAILLFDYAYLTVNAYSRLKQGMPSPWYIQKTLYTVGYIFK